MRLLFIGAVALVAGCIEPTPQDLAPPPTQDPTAAWLERTGCTQFHTYFDARAEDFQTYVPDGFSIETDESGLVPLRLSPTRCSDGAAELWITIPVKPPARYAIEGRYHQLAIEAYVSDGPLLQTYEGWQLPGVMEAKFSFATPVENAAVLVDEMKVDVGSRHYTLTLSMQTGSGPFPEQSYATFIAPQRAVAAVLLRDSSASVTRGFGTATFTSTGDSGAPPVTEGIAHVVTNFTERVELGALAP